MENKDNKSFDDFIKKKIRKNPDLPKDLNLEWENMNIDTRFVDNDNNSEIFEEYIKTELADSYVAVEGEEFAWNNMDIEIPKPKRKRFLFFYFMLGLLVFSSFGLGYWYSSDTQKLEDNKAAIIKEGSIVESSQLNKPNSDSNLNEINASKVLNLESDLLDDNQSNFDKRFDSTPSKNFTYSSRTKTNVDPFTNIDYAIKTEKTIAKVKQKIDNQSIDLLTEMEIKSNTPSIEPIVLFKKLALLDIGELNANNRVEQLKNILPLYPKRNKGKNKPYLLSIGVGNNLSYLSFDQENSVENNLTSMRGISLNFGIEKLLKNSFTLKAGFYYNEVHTAFTHTQVLSRERVPGENKNIVICQHIYHNNYSRHLSLGTGFGKILVLSKRLKVQPSISIQASTVLQRSGLTLQNDAVIELSEVSLDNKFNFSASPSLEMRYAINNRFSLQAIYGYQYNLTPGLSIDKNVTLKNHQYLTLGLGYTL